MYAGLLSLPSVVILYLRQVDRLSKPFTLILSHYNYALCYQHRNGTTTTHWNGTSLKQTDDDTLEQNDDRTRERNAVTLDDTHTHRSKNAHIGTTHVGAKTFISHAHTHIFESNIHTGTTQQDA